MHGLPRPQEAPGLQKKQKAQGGQLLLSASHPSPPNCPGPGLLGARCLPMCRDRRQVNVDRQRAPGCYALNLTCRTSNSMYRYTVCRAVCTYLFICRYVLTGRTWGRPPSPPPPRALSRLAVLLADGGPSGWRYTGAAAQPGICGWRKRTAGAGGKGWGGERRTRAGPQQRQMALTATGDIYAQPLYCAVWPYGQQRTLGGGGI